MTDITLTQCIIICVTGVIFGVVMLLIDSDNKIQEDE